VRSSTFAAEEPVSSSVRLCMSIAVDVISADKDFRGQIMGAVTSKVDLGQRSFDAKILRRAYDKESQAG
jgi:hypothetical protein